MRLVHCTFVFCNDSGLLCFHFCLIFCILTIYNCSTAERGILMDRCIRGGPKPSWGGLMLVYWFLCVVAQNMSSNLSFVKPLSSDLWAPGDLTPQLSSIFTQEGRETLNVTKRPILYSRITPAERTELVKQCFLCTRTTLELMLLPAPTSCPAQPHHPWAWLWIPRAGQSLPHCCSLWCSSASEWLQRTSSASR